MSWSHVVDLLTLKSKDAQAFYAEEAATKHLSVRELLEMHKDGIVVAEYWTALPPKAELEAV